MALLLLLFGGCGGGDAGAPRAVDTAADERETATPIDGLTCPNELRSVGNPDYASSTGGAPTAEEAARLLADPEDDVVIEAQDASTTTAYLLRPDETAHSRLDLVVLKDGTWRVEAIESCGDEGAPGR
jgi:hypothetical protein